MDQRQMTGNEQKLVAFVMDKVDAWKDHRDANFEALWREYERIWLGKFSENDRTRKSERARIISPASQQAVENIQAEIEEAVFGNKKEWFDIEDDGQDKDPTDVLQVKKGLQERFRKDKVKKYVSQCVTLGQVYGTGIGEIRVSKKIAAAPATEKLPVPGLAAVGVRKHERVAVEVRPIVPFNFFIDPNA